VRTFAEVGADDPSAMIDVAVQLPAQFDQMGSLEQLGHTDIYRKSISRHELGKVLIRLRSDSELRRFRYVALHELLHANGLNGHGKQAGTVLFAIAFPFTPIVEYTPSDGNTLRANYSR